MELPRREPTLEVELEAANGKGEEAVVAVLDTMTPNEMAKLLDRQLGGAATNGTAVREDEIELRVGADQMVEAFQSHLRELRGVTFDGKPYDRTNPEHRARVENDLPWAWQLAGGAKLVEHATLTREKRGN